MTAAQIIASLPRDPMLAKLELDGALDRRWLDEWSQEDRERLEAVREKAMRRARG